MLNELFPNVITYWDRFMQSVEATWQMFAIAGSISFFIGLAFGVILTITQEDGIWKNKTIHTVLDLTINFFRSIPFLILLIFLIPVTRLIVGTAIGVAGACVPLVFGTVPFFTRQVESVLASMDKGKVEAALSMGSSVWEIVIHVYLHESVPGLIRATVITAISLVGLTTMAGAVGAGGIGSFAINYGQGLHYQDIVNVCVILLLITVWLLQSVGNLLANKTTNRELFKKNYK